MRLAVVSDIHGNLAAFEAVLADLRETAPDMVLHGGDLAAPGSSPVEIVDRISELGWPGVLGNTDEMLVRPESLTAFAAQSKAPPSIWSAIGDMAEWSRQQLGEQRLAWLSTLPLVRSDGAMALVHASPGDCWRSPGATAGDEELQRAYAWLDRPFVIYGHIHIPFVRRLGSLMVANSGSVGQPLDGDNRACYLLLDESGAQIRRVEYDREEEIRSLRTCAIPHAEWLVKILESARPQMP